MCADRIYHITTAAELRAHCAGDSYRPPSLAHCWVSSKAPWFEISDELPRFDEGPPVPRDTEPER